MKLPCPVLLFYSNCSPALWSSLAGVNVEINPCRVRTDDVLLFYGFAAREAITQPLNLANARYSNCVYVNTVCVSKQKHA